MIYALLPSPWLKEQNPGFKPLQGEYTNTQLEELNSIGYNIYYYPNHPKLVVNPSEFFTGKDIDVFRWCYIDMDLKDGHWKSKDDFLYFISRSTLTPTKVVDSGNGIHAYYQVTDLDAKGFLQLNRQLARYFNTDLAVSKIKQLMRLPGTFNTKDRENPKLCEVLFDDGSVYTMEELANLLPPPTLEDKNYCLSHYNKTYSIEEEVTIKDEIPLKFAKLLKSNQEVKDIWGSKQSDRSTSDFRLGHLMLADGFTKDEAMSVLVNSAKALDRAPTHRISYASNIVDKIWAHEAIGSTPEVNNLSSSVEDILKAPITAAVGTPFRCDPIVDGTIAGFKLGQVLGLVGGSGIGKTTFTLNMFYWFVKANPDYTHFFISLEMPQEEIAERWKKVCGDNTSLHAKVHVLGNYNPDGTYRNLALPTIKAYILDFQKKTGNKIGCIVLDHIGILSKSQKNGETQGLLELCQTLKSFAIETKSFFVVQSQTNRDKAGSGDIELDKGAAFGTTTFEWYVDYLVTIWAPLKRIYDKMPDMTVTAFKFCKIRFKNVLKDLIQEDQRYLLMYEPNTEHYRMLNEEERKKFPFWNTQAVNARKLDRKVDTLEYTSTWTLQDIKANKAS